MRMNVEVILSVVIASSTVIYTIITLMTWYESKATRRQKVTPMLIAYLKTTENHMNLALHIKNIGEGYAKDVVVKIIKDYNQFDKANLPLSDIGIAKKGLNIFPPQYELRYYVHSMTKLNVDEKKEILELEITYKDQKGKNYKNSYSLPFNQMFGQNYSSPPDTYIGQVSHYLKEINTTLKERG
jgi:hypothetical protein